MNIQQIENEEFERNYHPQDRFAGFDRGDAGKSYEDEQAAMNEAEYSELMGE